LDYPDEAVADDSVGQSSYQWAGPRLRGTLSRWTPLMARRGPRRGAATASLITGAAPTSRKWPWVLVGSVTGAALTLVGLFAGIMLARKHEAAAPRVGIPPTATTTTAAPPPTTRAPAAPPAMLEGTYQVDVNRAQQTYNDFPDPQPPNVTTWWAFQSSCTPAGCIASGILLDDDKHQTVSTATGGHSLVLDFRDDSWQSRPETVQFPCLGPNGTPAKETTSQVISLQPQSHGPLRGTMTVTVETDECGQKGGRILIPAVGARVGDVPPGVIVPVPATTSSPTAPTTTTPTR
jgi:serine/threonine-protein kinase